MSIVVVVGTQWGDEGKGKIVDILTERASYVVRFQGGNNAGHTLLVGDAKYILHLIPSGILHPDKICLVGNGVIIDPEVIISEIEKLRHRGVKVTPDNLIISEKAHLIMPYHKAVDQAREEARGKEKIGTTGRGIGPCYEDKAARVGLRAVDFRDMDLFRAKVSAVLKEKNFILTRYFQMEPLNEEDIIRDYTGYAEFLKPFLGNVALTLDNAVKKGENILFEGAQGTHLDLDHGTYPYVTSSNPVAGSVTAGAGLGPKKIDRVMGLVKAYTTRVGEGPFPTELKDDIGSHMLQVGAEYGSTTGRPRRCGWLDMVVLEESVRLNSLESLALTKLDVLTGLDEIKICLSYKLDGRTIRHIPASLAEFERCEPVYETLPGWSEPISEARRLADLPRATQRYVARISELAGTPLGIVSVGPDREQTIMLENPF